MPEAMSLAVVYSIFESDSRILGTEPAGWNAKICPSVDWASGVLSAPRPIVWFAHPPTRHGAPTFRVLTYGTRSRAVRCVGCLANAVYSRERFFI